jgi:hypothetical protein
MILLEYDGIHCEHKISAELKFAQELQGKVLIFQCNRPVLCLTATTESHPGCITEGRWSTNKKTLGTVVFSDVTPVL